MSDEILRETSPTLTPEERERIRRERETEGMLEFYGGARLNNMVSYLKSNSINKIRSKEIYLDLEVDQITPMEDQPRKVFDREALDDLKASIDEKGLSTPILVRRVGDRFFIIAGERRWRAFKELGLPKIPAIIKDIKDDKEAYILAAIENLQREDLNVIEEALCYQKMLDTGAVASQKELAGIVGRNKSKISERLSLLKLPEDVKDMLCRKGTLLSEGHAIELLRLKDETKIIAMAERTMAEKLSRDELRKAIGRQLAGSLDPLPVDVELQLEPLAAVADDDSRPVLNAKFEALETPGSHVPSAPAYEAPWNVRFTALPDQGFDLIYRFRPALGRMDDLKDIIDDMGKRMKAFKKMRKELRRQGHHC